jgi:hypothetical protein
MLALLVPGVGMGGGTASVGGVVVPLKTQQGTGA